PSGQSTRACRDSEGRGLDVRDVLLRHLRRRVDAELGLADETVAVGVGIVEGRRQGSVGRGLVLAHATVLVGVEGGEGGRGGGLRHLRHLHLLGHGRLRLCLLRGGLVLREGKRSGNGRGDGECNEGRLLHVCSCSCFRGDRPVDRFGFSGAATFQPKTFRPRDSHERDVQERSRGSTRVGRNSCSCRPAKPSCPGFSNTLLSPLHSALGTRSASDRPDFSHAAPTCWTSWRYGSSCQVEGSLVSDNTVPGGTVAT